MWQVVPLFVSVQLFEVFDPGRKDLNVAGHQTMSGSAHCSDSTRCGSCWKRCFNYLWLKIKYLTPQVSGAPGRELAEAYGLTAQRNISDITHAKLIFVYFSCMQAMSNMRSA